MDASKKTRAELVIRFLAPFMIHDMGYTQVPRDAPAPLEELDAYFMSLSKQELVSTLRGIIAEFPAVFMEYKPVERVQKLCITYDLANGNPLKKGDESTWSLVSDMSAWVDKGEAWQKLHRNLPTDRVKLNKDAADKLMSVWNHDRVHAVPSDIVKAGTVPIPDIEITFEDFTYRVAIDRKDFPDRTRIGYAVFGTGDKDKRYFFVLYEDKGSETIYADANSCCVFDGVEQNEKLNYFEISQTIAGLMRLWYSVQLALLHPKLRYAFAHPRMERVYNPYAEKKTKQNRCFNIRYLKVALSDILTFFEEKGTHNITCPIWWVRGHSRRLKDKEIFVAGYFKGALRETGRIEEVRDRVIAV